MSKKPPTEEELRKALQEQIDNTPEDDFVYYQGCKTHGLVKRTGFDPNLCGDPECPSCSELDKAFRAHYEVWKKDNGL